MRIAATDALVGKIDLIDRIHNDVNEVPPAPAILIDRIHNEVNGVNTVPPQPAIPEAS